MSKVLIDVSEWNKKINWELVKNSIDGVIIRCGYGENIESQDDSCFKYNADECTRLGIPFGVYIYSYAINNQSIISEAEHVLRLIKGYKLSYPVYLDVEEERVKYNIKERIKIFADIIEGAGYWCGIYANKYWWETYLTGIDEYTKWVAQYYYKCTYEGTNIDIWQYSDTGIVNGINGYVDKNMCYKDFPSLINKKELKNVDDIILEIYDGKWGDGEERKNNLIKNGYDYKKIQDEINRRDSMKYHIVKSGDTLLYISKYYNKSISSLIILNHINNKNLIYVDQKILLK